MAEQAKAHLDSRRLENHDDRMYGDYILQLNDIEAVEHSPFSQRLMALGWLGLTEIVVIPDDDDRRKWLVFGNKKIPGSELMIAPHLGGELAVTASILADGERRLEFSFGAGDEEEYSPANLNEFIWDHLQAIHHAISKEGEGSKLPLAPIVD